MRLHPYHDIKAVNKETLALHDKKKAFTTHDLSVV